MLIIAELVVFFNLGFPSSVPNTVFNQAENNFGFYNILKASAYEDHTLNLECGDEL